MRSLRGQLLIAGPALTDPNFSRSVVLIGEHNAEGAMGVVLNRPTPVTVKDAVEPLATLVDDDEVVHVGGPVQREAVVVLVHFVEPHQADSLVFDTIGFLPGEVDGSHDLGEIHAARVYAGYSGWGPGQLERELDEDAWIVAPATSEDVFGHDAGTLWARVLRRLGGSYAVLALLPVDPRLN